MSTPFKYNWKIWAFFLLLFWKTALADNSRLQFVHCLGWFGEAGGEVMVMVLSLPWAERETGAPDTLPPLVKALKVLDAITTKHYGSFVVAEQHCITLLFLLALKPFKWFPFIITANVNCKSITVLCSRSAVIVVVVVVVVIVVCAVFLSPSHSGHSRLGCSVVYVCKLQLYFLFCCRFCCCCFFFWKYTKYLECVFLLLFFCIICTFRTYFIKYISICWLLFTQTIRTILSFSLSFCVYVHVHTPSVAGVGLSCMNCSLSVSHGPVNAQR